MSTKPDLSAAEISLIVGKAIESSSRKPFGLLVTTVERFEDDWWRVCVRPDREGVRADDYADARTSVEESLQTEQGLNIVLVPVLV